MGTGSEIMENKNWGIPLKRSRMDGAYYIQHRSKYHYFGDNQISLCRAHNKSKKRIQLFEGSKSEFDKLKREGLICARCLKTLEELGQDLGVDLDPVNKQSTQEIITYPRLDEMIGKIVTHNSGRAYRVIGVATHTENKGKLVIFKGIYNGSPLRAKPIEIFMKEVDLEKYPDSKQKYVYELSDKLNI